MRACGVLGAAGARPTNRRARWWRQTTAASSKRRTSDRGGRSQGEQHSNMQAALQRAHGLLLPFAAPLL